MPGLINLITNPHGGIKNPLADEFIQKKDQNIKFHLEKKGIKLNAVFLSHLHPNHIAKSENYPKTFHI